MEQINELLLLSGNDVPFRTGRCSIHQPRIKEIAYIGEESFQVGSRFLLFDKNNLDIQDKSGLEEQNNFNIFMSVMNSAESAKHKTDALMVLALFSGRLLVSRGIGMHKAAAVLLLAAIVFSAAGVPLVAFCL